MKVAAGVGNRTSYEVATRWNPKILPDTVLVFPSFYLNFSK